MSTCPWMCVLACGVLASSAAAQTTVTFNEPSGLAAEAEFSLANGGTQLVIRFRNVSTGVPAGFSNSDQILTSVSFDLGAPGKNAGDPAIVGGGVVTGPSSSSLNFDQLDVGASDDVSGEWGYGNGGTTMLHPNFLTAMQAGSTPFGGANLDGPADLSGPQGGLVPSPGPIVAIGGLGAVVDEVVATLDLDQALPDLGFLENGVRVEYGSDAAFDDGDCTDLARVTKVNDPGGLNAADALCAASGSLPRLGNAAFTLQMDDASNHCGITPGSPALVGLSPATAALPLARAGCAPGAPGLLMIDPSALTLLAPDVWAGPGSPTHHVLAIPSDSALCGLTCFAQGVWLDRRGDAGPYVLTNRLDIRAGL